MNNHLYLKNTFEKNFKKNKKQTQNKMEKIILSWSIQVLKILGNTDLGGCKYSTSTDDHLSKK